MKLLHFCIRVIGMNFRNSEQEVSVDDFGREFIDDLGNPIRTFFVPTLLSMRILSQLIGLVEYLKHSPSLKNLFYWCLVDES